MEKRFVDPNFTVAKKGLGFSGYAARYNQRSVRMFDFFEVIRPGAFTGAIDADVRAFWNHDYRQVLGRTTAGTLALRDDADGLHFSLDLPKWAKGYHETVKRGDVSGMSFGFAVKKDDWQKLEGDLWLREILSVDLFEISPVTFPAYSATSLDTRSLGDTQEIVNQRVDTLLHNADVWTRQGQLRNLILETMR